MGKQITDEERDRRIELVGEYVLYNGASTREAASFFTENLFPISNYTVSDYCKKYKKKHPDKALIIERTFAANKKELSPEEKRVQVLKNAKLILSGFTIEEISEKTGESYWSVYRDLTVRLKEIDLGLFTEIKQIMHDRSKDNLRR